LTLFDTLILCRFYRDMYPFPDLGRIIAATTGLQLDEAGLREMAARVTDDARRFNIQEGLTPEDDRLPKRLVTEPLETGQAMTEDELLRLRADYYRLRGWDESGAPR
jgi:aldehyde:ferredoxin oxidoreductase